MNMLLLQYLPIFIFTFLVLNQTVCMQLEICEKNLNLAVIMTIAKQVRND